VSVNPRDADNLSNMVDRLKKECCPYCGGTGEVTVPFHRKGGWEEQDAPCPYCKGEEDVTEEA